MLYDVKNVSFSRTHSSAAPLSRKEKKTVKKMTFAEIFCSMKMKSFRSGYFWVSDFRKEKSAWRALKFEDSAGNIGE
jgi:hypothetical protein